MTYREPSPRDDYTIEPGSRVRFAYHKYPELEGYMVLALYRRNGQWALQYGSLHGHILHDEKDLIPT